MLKIGWASRDVSTNEPVLITGQGYERISTGSLDPTTITVLVLESGQDSVIFLPVISPVLHQTCLWN